MTSTSQPNSKTWDERHLRLGVTAAGIALWAWNVDTDRLTMDEIGYDLWHIPEGAHVTFENLSANIHPADRDRVQAAFNATRGIVGAYEIDFRTMMSDKAPKPERPLYLDMDFGEALRRFAQTKPEEVTPAPGQKKKAARPGAKPKSDGPSD